MRSNAELIDELIADIRKDAEYLLSKDGITHHALTQNVIKSAGAAALYKQFTVGVAKDLMSKMLAALTLAKKSQELV